MIFQVPPNRTIPWFYEHIKDLTHHSPSHPTRLGLVVSNLKEAIQNTRAKAALGISKYCIFGANKIQEV